MGWSGTACINGASGGRLSDGAGKYGHQIYGLESILCGCGPVGGCVDGSWRFRRPCSGGQAGGRSGWDMVRLRNDIRVKGIEQAS